MIVAVFTNPYLSSPYQGEVGRGSNPYMLTAKCYLQSSPSLLISFGTFAIPLDKPNGQNQLR